MSPLPTDRTPFGDAVLLVVFNRPDTTRRVMERLREVRPSRLYVAGDGPRPGRPDDPARCRKVRRLVEGIDWPCDLTTRWRPDNAGCRVAVAAAITWFFEHEDRGIILEDDCLPHPDFFAFASALLDRYADDERVMAVTGGNYQDGQRRTAASYYFSKYPHVWGWATWARAWEHYDDSMAFWPSLRRTARWHVLHPKSVERRYWSELFSMTKRGQIDSWAYVWTASVWNAGGVTATPTVNLVENVGFDSDATHTGPDSASLAAPTSDMEWPLIHPSDPAVDTEADAYVLHRNFEGGWSLPRHVAHRSRRLSRRVFRHGRGQ